MKRAISVYPTPFRSLLAGLSVFLVVASSAPAADGGSAGGPAPEHEALRSQGIAFHDRALAGDEESAGRAVERLERYLERFSEDGEARAYLGSAYALMGRDASSVVNKMRYTNRGLRHLDRALDLAPRDFAVRYIRSRVNAGLPKMFGRGDAAIEDMRTLDAIFHENPSPGLARWMIDIYEDLADLAPDAGPWEERLARSRELAEGS